ncbi:hypothetical protein JOF36_005328 [Pseudonocardia parietis]|uniref:Uncharacterized protein n=1 Tax=Pseudonocardia parietis TaxID=570936 RepID=A0ABS4W0B8_9PSEU|nr:hypothetical protein [Pseudonocardia parietis]
MDEWEAAEHRESEVSRWHGDDIAKAEASADYEDGEAVMS